jgi:hypothetical protein
MFRTLSLTLGEDQFDLDRAVLQRRDLPARVFTGMDLDELVDHQGGLRRGLEPNPSATSARYLRMENSAPARDLSCEFAKVSGKGWRRQLNAGRLLYVISFFLPWFVTA